MKIVRDDFLLKHMKKNSGWTDIKLISSFKRMKALCGTNSMLIVQAIELSDVLQMDTSLTKVKRKTDIADIATCEVINIYIMYIQYIK